MPAFSVRAFTSLLFIIVLAGCSPALPPATEPPQPIAAESTGRASVKAVTGPSAPLIVDWKPEERADLEEAIHDGVAIMEWSDAGLRLLRGCHLDGEYGYLPVQMKKDLVRLETAEEVKANLPLGAAGLLGKIGGELGRGATLDIAMAMVGKRRTTWHDVTDQDVKGKCSGASHFVRALLVGAFAMKTGSKTHAAAAVEIFGAGAGGSLASSKDVNRADGKLDECEKATGEEAKPPAQCAAVLRLELEPITKGAAPAPTPVAAEGARPVDADEAPACAEGMVFRQGKCAALVADVPHACKATDFEDCKVQCSRNDARSCDQLGVLIAQKTPSDASINGLFDKACKLGDASGCANLGTRLLSTPGQHNPGAAAPLLEKACAMGDARGCSMAGDLFWVGNGVPSDGPRAMRSYAKGCDGGDQYACTNLGVIYMGGAKGVTVDFTKGAALARRACYGGVSVACGNAGAINELGLGTTKNLPLAVLLFDRACKMDPAECYRLAIMQQAAEGMPANDGEAKKLFASSCKAASQGLAVVSCFLGQKLYGSGRSIPADAYEFLISMQKPQCENGTIRSCTFVGVAEVALGRAADGSARLRAACAKSDPWACTLSKRGL
jgi:hypothetical protein